MRWILTGVLLPLLLTQCCVSPLSAEPSATPTPPLFEGLGTHGRKITTSSEQAQRYFNQGLCLLFAFNHDEAIRSFRYAAELDPKCAMAWWGVSIANGPHINNPIHTPESAKAAWEALQQAKQLASGASAIEQELIAALETRYAEQPPEDRKPLDEAYAAAMRQLWKAHPTDADLAAMFAEAMMDFRPWDLWQADGTPQPGTDEIVATLEAALTQDPLHPLALHLYVHAVEASPTPEKAIAPADRLRHLQPGLGHMVHMPSHVDVRTGRWDDAMLANQRAIETDRKYRELSPQQGFYRIYMAHNLHMLSFAAIMTGQSKLAIKSINEMTAGMPTEWVKENALFADGFMAAPLEVLVRFGRWDEILAAPEPPDYLPLSRAMRHGARGIAYAAKGDVEKAKAEQTAFLAAKAKVPEEFIVGNNKASDILNVAESLLAGEILIRADAFDDGVAKLREAVTREDALKYSEPPDWIHPVRHALGATLLAHNDPVAAEQVYREDLKKSPNNGWSLFGLARSLQLRNNPEAAPVQKDFEQIWRNADITITSSCFCQPSKLVESK